MLRRSRRLRPLALTAIALAVLMGVNLPPAVAYVQDWQYQRLINSLEYQREFGKWDVLDLPVDQRVNAIHSALLPSGKIMLIAGSGNKEDMFATKALKSLLYDPATGESRVIPVPDDMFCAGQTLLPDGRLLVAGGTARYEKLDGAVTYAGGAMRVKNENPDVARDIPAGTEFVSPEGKAYRTIRPNVVPPAAKVATRTGATVTAAEERVFVEAVAPGPQGITLQPGLQYAITGLDADAGKDVYGLGEALTLDKQNYQGTDTAFTFDPVAETWTRVDDMDFARWYPTLTPLPNGDVLTLSGLDNIGNVLNGETEHFDPRTNRFVEDKQLTQYFPTYPSVFATGEPGRLFYTGTNSGYGPAEAGRLPGFWDLDTNVITPVPGLRDPNLLETGGSAWLGPVQDQRMVVVGGGGIGESPLTTGRIDEIDLDAPDPAFRSGPVLPDPVRYPNLTTLPDDSMLISHGSRDYRGKGDSDVLDAHLLRPTAEPGGTLVEAADPHVGRNYHGQAVLLPDGRVLTAGSDPLFDDERNTIPGTFEQRLEIYSPPYLFQGGDRPEITAAPDTMRRGTTVRVETPDAERIGKVRLMRLMSSTHVTAVDQFSIAVDARPAGPGALELTLPPDLETMQVGNYMLVLVDDRGVPSVGSMVRVP
ncbi:galactose oxidase early set domain-containing protein [Actinomycetospora termitidis]|uniref:Galactose oxidase early set domain-containing protein n=1 Tax=Actinomycetospora termitidis TaxID=3053470 RepID=A0ABT7M5D1_9PSEU|nr:galactose oxidase early set domain-containing protein [Actinomycetospora sp. Odt1-22]MDL5155869.1 galactose oxidase early set domain-containing protein [Actinomycetospora sp. Odt1-22]